MGFILAHRGSRGLQKDGDELKFVKDARFVSVCTTTSEKMIDRKDASNRQNLVGLERTSMVKTYVAE